MNAKSAGTDKPGARILVLKTCVDWCLRAFVEEFRRADRISALSLLTNTSDCDLEFEHVFRYAPGRKLTAASVEAATIDAIRRAKFDRVVILTAVKIPAMYRHVFDFVRTLGLPEPEVYFRHAPDGDYDARFKAGFWMSDEEENAWYVRALFEKADLVPDQSPRILDLGCGRGVWARHMRALGFSRVVGTDLSMDGLIDAASLAPGLLLCRADIFRLPFPPDTFDCLFLNAPGAPRIEMSPLAGFGCACHDLLRPGGVMIQAQPSIDMSGDPKGDPLEVRYLSDRILTDYYRTAGFSQVENFLTDRAALRERGAAALTREETERNATEALIDVRFRVTVTIARRGDEEEPGPPSI